MSPEQKRNFNTIAGAFFSLGALTFLALTVYLIVVPAPKKPVPVKGVATISKESCADYLRTLDFTVNTNEEGILKVNGSMRPELDETASKFYLDRVSLATAVCQYPLKEFCMGPECANSQVNFSLKIPDDATQKQSTTEVKAGGGK